MDWKEISKKLQAPFPVEDIHWRVGNSGKTKAGGVWVKILAYIANRDVMDRLDDVFGPNGWKNEYVSAPGGGILCGIAVLDLETEEWIWKWDGAENTDIEAVKGGLSDSMKRAAVQWGVGRYLYGLGETFADVVTDKGQHKSKVKIDGRDEYVNWNVPASVKKRLGIPYQEPAPAKEAPATVVAEAPPAKKPAPKVTEPAKPGLTPSTVSGDPNQLQPQNEASCRALAKYLRSLGAMNLDQYETLLLKCHLKGDENPTYKQFKSDAVLNWRHIKDRVESWLALKPDLARDGVYDHVMAMALGEEA